MIRAGIALSGGGSRGIMHIGILKAIDEAGIKLSMVSGTSAGAIVGAFYCSGYAPESIMEIIRETKLIKYVRPAMSSSGLLNIDAVGSVFRTYLKNDSFESLNIPLFVAATNVRKGMSEIFDQGALIHAVLASCAVPVIFRPVQIKSEFYIDGGILNNLPVEPLIGKCDVIIGSNCNAVSENYKIGNMRSLVERSLLMAIGINTLEKKRLCDLFLEPEGLKDYGGFDFSKAEKIFEIGYQYGKSVITESMGLFTT